MGVSRRSVLAGAALAVGGAMLAPARASAAESLAGHPMPAWYPRAKFGIFIHWGPYSVPAWGGEHSAEWYCYAMRVTRPGKTGTREHHLATYGAGFAYDDFIPRFTAERFDPRAWVRLFEAAGARYFVLTSKHHDGFQLFGNRFSDRHSVALGPRRDLVGALFRAARHSRLKRGLYYSLGEFYSPALGTPPRNPYTGEPVPYTGFRPVADYVTDYEQPQLRHLIDTYHPDVLWADGNVHRDFGGGPIFRPPQWNWRSDEILAYYYDRARWSNPDGVVVNDRFDASHADFATVEGDKTYRLRPDPWEACVTIGRSWGWDENQDPAGLKSPATLVWLLADVVSKNGNLLLNVGPKADGTIAGRESSRLLEIGRWLRVNGKAIFGTGPWRRAEDGELRYTRSADAFHILSRTWQDGELVVPGDLPITGRSRIELLGGPGGPLPWRRRGDHIAITLPVRRPPLTERGFPTAFAVSGVDG
ncbi:alpha-L-fucosidase [Amycolatopsis anabasis]|uniref:alpha-L-fucosidase n=1 Tax=Amycolatopsis anabasis TaxID=1840409 RepID=UPI00131D67F5|nr:alpha-L-fucosidase [Amycolatopsis anabasis]